MPAKLDLTNQRFGRLIALREATNEEKEYKKGVFWYCLCDCGNTTVTRTHSLRCGETKSCGCYNKMRVAETQRAKVIDMTGQHYGRLTVLYYDKSSPPGETSWFCRCDCGNIVSAKRESLIAGKKMSCGCLKKERFSLMAQNPNIHFYKKETNNKYGKLTVIREYNSSIDGEIPNYGGKWWVCVCECGKKCIVNGSSLRTGNTTSCGCCNSRGELEIRNLLEQNNIKYIDQFKVNIKQVSDNRLLRFDFAASTSTDPFFFIEFDGIQHSEPVEFFGGENYYKEMLKNDQLKNEFCINNHIPLIRIPYKMLSKMTIDDLLPSKSKYLLTDKDARLIN